MLLKKPAKKRIPWKTIGLLFFIIILSWCGYFGWKLYSVSRAIHISAQSSDTQQTTPSAFEQLQSIATSIVTTDTSLKGAADGRINILLLGRAGEHHSGRNLTDTLMIMSIDTRTKKVALLSLPRDLYVNIPDTHSFTKINAVYQQGLVQNDGISLIERTVTTITGLPIHYSFVIDFDGFEKVITEIGGVNVEVMRDIYDSRYPGPNYSYETFEIKKGWQTLDGPTALKYVRERHDDPEGDFGRAKRQQQVIQAVKSKAFSLKTFMDAFTLNNLLTILGDNIKTTIAPEEINGFIALSKQADTAHISNIVIDAWKPDSLLRVSHIMIGPTRMFILVPRIGNYSEIQDVAANIFDIDALKRREAAIADEQPSITLINRSNNPQLSVRVAAIIKNIPGFDQSHIEIVASTEPSQDDSFIVDHIGRQKPFSLDELLKKLPLSLQQEDAETMRIDDRSGDFTILLGKNLSKNLDFEEDSIDDFKRAEDDPIAYPADMMP